MINILNSTGNKITLNDNGELEFDTEKAKDEYERSKDKIKENKQD